MNVVSSLPTERVKYTGIKVMNTTGTKRALIDLQDEQPTLTTLIGDATGTIENLQEVTDELGTGHTFDIVLLPGSASTVNQLQGKFDKDQDAGEVGELLLDISYTVKSEEAGAFALPDPTIEAIA